jgi:hypothetical protein
MNDLDFEALKALPDEEFTRTFEKRLKTLTRRFATLPDEGDMGYVQYMSEKIRVEIDRLDAIILGRIEKAVRRTRKSKDNRRSKLS